MQARSLPDITIGPLTVSAYRIPTDAPESDGTLEWKATTLVLVEIPGGNERGIGYTYADTATAHLIKDMLAGVVAGMEAMNVPGAWAAMVHAIRNLGRPGIASMAIAAVDIALWDLKARLLGLPLVTLLGYSPRKRASVWQRRLHFIFRRSIVKAVRGLGRARHNSF